MITPGKSASTRRITGADKGEKFRVGSSSTSTLAPFSTMARNSSLARWPPDSPAAGSQILVLKVNSRH